MNRHEVTFERPTDYSEWHRTLPDSCPVTDIDYLEIRCGEIKAIIETKRGLYKRNHKNDKCWIWQKSILINLSKKLNCSAYLVEYDINVENYDMNLFDVTNLITDKEYSNITEYKYKKFIKSLDEKYLSQKEIIECNKCKHIYDQYEYSCCPNCIIIKKLEET